MNEDWTNQLAALLSQQPPDQYPSADYWGMMAENNPSDPRMTQGMMSNPEMSKSLSQSDSKEDNRNHRSSNHHNRQQIFGYPRKHQHRFKLNN